MLSRLAVHIALWSSSSILYTVCLGDRFVCLRDNLFNSVLFHLFYVCGYAYLPMQQYIFLHSAASIYWLVLSISVYPALLGGYFSYVICVAIFLTCSQQHVYGCISCSIADLFCQDQDCKGSTGSSGIFPMAV